MKPVMQTAFGYPNGNCFAACVASLLELSIEEMPGIEGKRFEDVWDEWLSTRGLTYVDVPAGTGAFVRGYCIATGKSPRGGVTQSGRPVLHAVIAKDMQLVYDPHPDRAFLDGAPVEWTIIYPLDPSILALTGPSGPQEPK